MKFRKKWCIISILHPNIVGTREPSFFVILGLHMVFLDFTVFWGFIFFGFLGTGGPDEKSEKRQFFIFDLVYVYKV